MQICERCGELPKAGRSHYCIDCKRLRSAERQSRYRESEVAKLLSAKVSKFVVCKTCDSDALSEPDAESIGYAREHLGGVISSAGDAYILLDALGLDRNEILKGVALAHERRIEREDMRY